ncbi:hypothetical protein OH77DRAFT_1309664 [Trametes cingulata]|nr:hypothetical protein OH77DRAFT_1309664 [Trametes cingulata]
MLPKYGIGTLSRPSDPTPESRSETWSSAHNGALRACAGEHPPSDDQGMRSSRDLLPSSRVLDVSRCVSISDAQRNAGLDPNSFLWLMFGTLRSVGEKISPPSRHKSLLPVIVLQDFQVLDNDQTLEYDEIHGVRLTATVLSSRCDLTGTDAGGGCNASCPPRAPRTAPQFAIQ